MFKLGLCQMRVTADKAENLRHAGELIRQAAAQGANVVTLPEMFNCPYENACFPVYGEPAGGESWQFLSGIAKELGIYLIGGSVPELEDGKIYNTSYIFSPEGKELARHRKVHLFDIDVPGGQRFMESDTLTAGDSVTVVDTGNRFLGGAIIPGVVLSMNALSAGTSLLQKVPVEAPKKVICGTTIESMQSGAVFGNAAMLDGMIDRFEQELGCPMTVVATGGIAAKIVPHCRHKIVYDENLLLRGLGIIYKKNRRDRS